MGRASGAALTRRRAHALTVLRPEGTLELLSPRRGKRARQLERAPARRALDVRASPPALDQMEVQEREPARVEDARALLDDAFPAAHCAQHVGEIVEQL